MSGKDKEKPGVKDKEKAAAASTTSTGTSASTGAGTGAGTDAAEPVPEPEKSDPSKPPSDPPSIEKYTQVKNQLTQQILKKQELTAKLNQLEDSIYEKETEYFSESAYGNIVKGFENFSKTSGGSGSNKKRFHYTDEDHIFSLSSVNYIKTFMKRHGVPFAGINGEAIGTEGSNGSSAREDFDEYEDSVDPTNAAVSNPRPDSNSATPTRKRKIRALDD